MPTNFLSLREIDRRGGHHDRADFLLGHSRKGGVNIAAAARTYDFKPPTHCACGRSQVFHLLDSVGRIGINNHADRLGVRHRFAPEPDRTDFYGNHSKSRR